MRTPAATLLRTADAVARLGGSPSAFAPLSKRALLDAMQAIADLRQCCDTYTAWIAAELARRSAAELGSAGLAQEEGFRNGGDPALQGGKSGPAQLDIRPGQQRRRSGGGLDEGALAQAEHRRAPARDRARHASGSVATIGGPGSVEDQGRLTEACQAPIEEAAFAEDGTVFGATNAWQNGGVVQRLSLDSGTAGVEHVKEVNRAALNGILVTGVMRYVLFLAILGVVASGVVLDTTANPGAQAFEAAAGEAGLRIFGAIFWIAAITSVIGAAYTSVSFLPVFSAKIQGRTADYWTVGFIVLSLAVYLAIGTAPATLLVFVGGLNGLILPIGLTLFMYIGWFRPRVLGSYKYPKWLLVIGTLATIITWYMAVNAVGPIFALITG